MRLFDFRCRCGNEYEGLVKSDDVDPQCPECSSTDTTRLLSTPTIKLEGLTGDFPGAALSWAKKHEKAAKEAAKANPENPVNW